MRAVVAVMLALVAVPTVAAVPTTLYAHVVRFEDFPLNTQQPDDSWSTDVTTGMATNTLSCIPKTPLVNVQQDYHTFRGFASPHLVNYDMESNGEPTVQAERGLKLDVHIDPAVPMVLHWYWSSQESVPVTGTLQEPTVVPNVVVHAVLRTHDAISVDDKAYDDGTVIAEGETAPALLAGPGSQGVEHDVVGGRTVYHFAVPLTVVAPVIPHEAGYNLRVDTFVQSPACGSSGRVMPNTVALHSSPGHRPRIELGVANPFDLSWGTASAANGTVTLPLYAKSPWGKYDATISGVTITGPSPATTVHAVPGAPVFDTDCHCLDKADRALWAWDYRADHATPGPYVAHVTMRNLQGATEVRDVAFAVPGEHALPALPLGFLLMALAALAVGLRRR